MTTKQSKEQALTDAVVAVVNGADPVATADKLVADQAAGEPDVQTDETAETTSKAAEKRAAQMSHYQLTDYSRDDLLKMDQLELLDAAKKEHKALQTAAKAGAPLPPTPVLDYMHETDYEQRKANGQNKPKTASSTGGNRVKMTDEQIRDICKPLIEKGATTKGAVIKAFRAAGHSASWQRVFPIIEPLLPKEAAKAPRAAKAPTKKAAPAKSTASKSSAAKAPAKKVADKKAPSKSPSEIGAQAAASKASAQRRDTKAAAVKKTA